MLGTARLSGLPSLAPEPRLGVVGIPLQPRRGRGHRRRRDVRRRARRGEPTSTPAMRSAPDRPWGDASVRHAVGGGGAVTLRAALRETRDVGLAPAVPPAMNTLAGLFLADDWTDPYYATGARLTIRHAVVPRVHGTFAVGLERHRSASLTQRDAPLTVAVERAAADLRTAAWSGALSVEAGVHDGGTYVRPVLETAVRRATADHARTLELRGSAGWVSAAAPLQRLFALGGHGTLPGYDYRAFAGSRYGLLQAEGTWAVDGAMAHASWRGRRRHGGRLSAGLPSPRRPGPGTVGERRVDDTAPTGRHTNQRRRRRLAVVGPADDGAVLPRRLRRRHPAADQERARARRPRLDRLLQGLPRQRLRGALRADVQPAVGPLRVAQAARRASRSSSR
jgi:hypothetical protein